MLVNNAITQRSSVHTIMMTGPRGLMVCSITHNSISNPKATEMVATVIGTKVASTRMIAIVRCFTTFQV